MGCAAGRGLVIGGVALAALATSLARPVSAEEAGALVTVPSGREVRWIDTISDAPGPDGLTLRFRFLVPGLGAPVWQEAPERAEADMQALCDGFALPRLATVGPRPAQVVISLSDRVLPFGEVDETAVQFFEAYSVANGACEWELF